MLYKQDIPHPIRVDTQEQLTEHLSDQGLNYIGEYPHIDEAAKRANTAARFEEKAAAKLIEAQEAEKSGNVDLAQRLYRSVDYWRAQVDEYRGKS